MEWVDEYKVYAVLGFYILLFVTLFGFGAYIRLTTGEGLFGNFGFAQIPPRMRWMPVVATIATLYMMAYTLVYIIYPDIQNYYLPLRALQDARVSLLGMFLNLSGSIVMVVSQLQLGRSYRFNLPKAQMELVTTGLYAFSRNPLYLGLYIALFGVFLMLPNWLFLFSLLIFITNYHFKIVLLEERYLEDRFGDTYRQYCKRVNRYF